MKIRRPRSTAAGSRAKPAAGDSVGGVGAGLFGPAQASTPLKRRVAQTPRADLRLTWAG